MRIKSGLLFGMCCVLALLLQGRVLSQTAGAGTAFVFDGINDQLQVPSFGTNAPTNEITIEFWQKVTVKKDQYTVSMNLGVVTDRLSIMTPWSDGIVYWNFGNVSGAAVGRLTYTPPVAVTNNWHHFAFVASQSGNFMKIYRNGVEEATKVGMTPFVRGSFDLLVGFTSPNAFGGNIDEFRIWKTARGVSEISTNMNRRLLGTEPNLVLYYRADEGSGTTATNSAAGGFNGNLLSGATFVNSGAPIGPPLVTTLAASGVTNVSATVNASVNPVGQAAGVYFQYGLTTNYTDTTGVTNLTAGTNVLSISNLLTGLSGGTTYQFRAVATNAGGLAYGSNLTFITTAQVPIVTTLAATGVGSTAATLNGTVNANNNLTTAYFQYGLTTGYGSVVNVAGTFNGSGTASAASAVSSLIPGSTYHFRMVGTNLNGLGLGGDLTFNTPAAAPSATTLAASTLTPTSATLNSTVSGNGAATIAFFQWGLTTSYGTSTTPQAVAASAVNTAVNAPISGLAPGATYHFRSVASNSLGATFDVDLTFTTPPLPPAANTFAAGSVTATTVTLNGTVTANGAPVTAFFQWGTNTSYGSSTAPQNFGSGASATPFADALAGLQPGVTYRFRAVATNAAGTSFGGDQAFTTSPDAPSISTVAASVVTSSGATLNGTVSANGAATGVYFEYGTTAGYGTTTSAQNFPTNAVNAAAAAISGLPPGILHHFRAVATNSVGTNFGGDLTFTTLPDPPNSVTLAAGGVTKVAATLNGTVTANGNGATAYFQWGTNTSYGSNTAPQNFPADAAATPFNASIAGLAPGVSYHFRAVSTNTAGIGFGANQVFTTLPDFPAVTTVAASAVTSSAATLNGTVTANGAATGVYFEYGATTDYGTTTSAQNFATNAAATAASKSVSGLLPGALYHFRAVATNSVGTNFGGDLTFTTLPQAPVATSLAATGLTTNAATLNGTVTANGAAPTAYFQWGTTAGYGSVTSPQNFSVGASNTAFNAALAGLQLGTTYHFRAVATNIAGTGFGSDQVFTTLFLSPSATTLAASGLTAGSATLNGSASPGGGATAYFEYGLTTSYGSATVATNLTGVNAVALSKILSGLGGSSTYHYRLVVSNSAGVALGSDQAFTTLVPGPGSAVSFDGVDDKVTVANFCATAPTNEITIEFWQKVSGLAEQATFTVNSPSINNLINAHIPYSDGVVYWDFGDFAAGGRLSYAPPQSILGTWQHFALVASQSGNLMQIYRNGVLEAQKSGMTPFVRGNFDLIIGGNSLPFGGVLDEFRIWNVARNASQIQTNMNRRLTGNETNLAAYYRFDEGTGTTASDSSGHALTATLLNGTAWVTSDAPIGLATATTLAATSITGSSATFNGTANANGVSTTTFFQYGTTTNYGSTALVTNIGVGSAAVSLAGAVSGLTPGTVYHFRLVSSNGVGVVNGFDEYFATPLPVAGTAVSLDGVNDFVYTPDLNSALSGRTMTAEIWFKASGAGVILDERGQLPSAPSQDWLDSQIEVFGSGEVKVSVWHLTPVSVGTVAFGTWNHAVVRYNHATKTLDGFLNGVQSSTVSTNVTGRLLPSDFTINALYYGLGLADSVNPMGVGAGAPFAGQIDEFRIWNTARSFSQIQTNMNRRLLGTESDLVLYYRLDEATGLPVADSSGHGLTGTLFNGAAWIGSTAPLFSAPAVTTLAASGVSANAATLNGSVTADGLATTAFFQWGTTTSYGSNTAPQNIASNSINVSFNAALAGLTPGVTYHFRALATNGYGTNAGGDQAFTAPLVLPTVTTLAAGGVTSTAATLNGSVTANGAATAAYFQWGATTNYGTATTPQNFAGNASGAACNAAISGLTPGALYHFRAVATNAAGTNFGGDLTFTTTNDPPSVTTLPASAITHSGAILNGTINANGSPTLAWFQYGPTTSYGSSTNVTNLLNGVSIVAVSNIITGLTPGAVYYFRLVATNSAGQVAGSDQSFTNPPLPSVSGSGFLGNGQFKLQITGAAGLGYSVFGATNLTSPINWDPLGSAAPLGGGSFEFIDANATNFPARFYQLRSP